MARSNDVETFSKTIS